MRPDRIADRDAAGRLVHAGHAGRGRAGRPRNGQARHGKGRGAGPCRLQHSVPRLRQFSAGGATSPDEYDAWIEAFAAGIGTPTAIVILEPDGLGIIPWYNPFADRDTWVTNPNYEWCQPAEADPATASVERFAMLNTRSMR